MSHSNDNQFTFKFYDSTSSSPPAALTSNSTTQLKASKFSIIGIVTCFTTLLLAIYFKDSILNVFVYLDAIETQNYFLLNVIIFLLFQLCSLPILWGYSLCVLIVSYVHEFYYGFILSVVYSSVGMAFSFYLCRYLFTNFQCTNKYTNLNINNQYFAAFISCIEGPNGYRIILLSRIIPLPFGLANLLYSTTRVHFGKYICASCIGLVPTQLFTCFIGSKLKSIQDIIAYSKSKSAMHAYYILAIQILISFILMYYLIKMAKIEFDKRLNNVNSSHLAHDDEFDVEENKASLSSIKLITTASASSSSNNFNVIKTNELVN